MALSIVYLYRGDTEKKGGTRAHDITGWVLLVLSIIDICLVVAYLYASTASRDQLVGLAAVQLLVAAYVPFEMYSGVRSSKTKRLWNAFLAKLLNMCIASAEFDGTSGTTVLLVLFIVCAVIENCLILSIMVRSAPHQRDLVWKNVSERRQFQAKTAHSVQGISETMHSELRRTRTAGLPDSDELLSAMGEVDELVFREDVKAATQNTLRMNHFALLVFGVLAVATANFILETAKIVTRQDPMFVEDDVDSMASIAGADRLSPEVRLNADNKVLIVIMDGLRADYVDYMSFWDHQSYIDACTAGTYTNCVNANDVASLTIENQLPSMSVPNWLTTLTGAPPEATGIIGNIFAPDHFFESIYSVAEDADILRMITGTPWFAGIVRSKLPWLRGDGTIDAAYDTEETTASTSAPADAERQEVALTAIAATDDPYGLMLVHFSDIDSQGHALGVTDKFNSNNTYVNSINEKTEFLRQLCHAIDDNTVAIVVSDHGHIDHGGHGGIDQVLRDIPLVMYKRNSGLKSINDAYQQELATGSAETVSKHTNMDIAPTVSALLGLRTPGQNFGTFLEPAMQLTPAANMTALYKDLYAQKVALLTVFATRYNVANDGMPSVSACDEEIAQNGVHCRAAINSIIAYYDNTLRPSAVNTNYAAGFIVFFVVMGSTVLLMEFTEIASPLAICCRAQVDIDTDELEQTVTGPAMETYGNYFLKKLEVSRRPGQKFADAIKQAIAVSDIDARVANFVDKVATEAHDKNRLALTWIFCGVLLYYGLSIGIYVVAVLAMGYTRWDSTQIHSPGALTVYLGIVLGPSSLFALILTRSYSVFHHDTPRQSSKGRQSAPYHCGRKMYRLFFDDNVTYRDPVMVYLCDAYLQFFAVFCSMIVLLFICDWTYYFTVANQIPFINPNRWALRFRAVTVLGFNLPLAIAALFKEYTWNWGAVKLEDYVKFLDIQSLPPPSLQTGRLDRVGTFVMSIRKANSGRKVQDTSTVVPIAEQGGGEVELK